MSEAELTPEERELLGATPPPGLDPAPEQEAQDEVKPVATDEDTAPKRRGRPRRNPEPKTAAAKEPETTEPEKPAEAEETAEEKSARGPFGTAQHDDDGWDGLPVQMRG